MNNFSFRKTTELPYVLNNLKSNIGPGLEAKLIKWAANVFIYHFADLFDLSVSTGEIPHA